MTKMNKARPKKGTLISNLLNRVDGKYLSVSAIPKNGGLIFQFENESVPKLKASRQCLALLSYDECEFLLDSGSNIIKKDLTLKMFPELKTFVKPENVRRTYSYVTTNQNGNSSMRTFDESTDFKQDSKNNKFPKKHGAKRI